MMIMANLMADNDPPWCHNNINCIGKPSQPLNESTASKDGIQGKDSQKITPQMFYEKILLEYLLLPLPTLSTAMPTMTIDPQTQLGLTYLCQFQSTVNPHSSLINTQPTILLIICPNSTKLTQPLISCNATGPGSLHSTTTLTSNALIGINSPALLHPQSSLPMMIPMITRQNLMKTKQPSNGYNEDGCRPRKQLLKASRMQPKLIGTPPHVKQPSDSEDKAPSLQQLFAHWNETLNQRFDQTERNLDQLADASTQQLTTLQQLVQMVQQLLERNQPRDKPNPPPQSQNNLPPSVIEQPPTIIPTLQLICN